ncbi:hypothetical protein [Paenibacillus sp. 276b]|uniref:hypothetical protein n=1 Tax=Paenibacillus sp. 276b TaxID=1566277 RepID=UPI000B80DB29|nr:hypothetical protein [Paenibacillus sp. 276b]
MNDKDRPRLISWKFDDKVESDNSKEWNWVEITMNFSDDSRRWSILYTPERLLNNLSREGIDPPGLHMQQLIVVRSYSVEDIERVLIYFDEEDSLIEASRAYPEE